MLSIVEMDFDSDVEILDEDPIKSEIIDLEATPISDEKNAKNDLHDLELVPIVYTTKLDDMGVLKFDPDIIRPDEASAWILNKSKPVLTTYPGSPQKGRRNTRKFGKVKSMLEKIYCPNRNTIKTKQTDEDVINSELTDEIFIKNEPMDDLDTYSIRIDLNSVKSEASSVLIVEKSKPDDTCKYSELLKLCKPCSVLLTGPVLTGDDTFSKVIHGGQLLKVSRVQKPRQYSTSHSRSSEDEAPLITLYPPDLLVERKKNISTKRAPPNLLVKRKSIGTQSSPPDRAAEHTSITVNKTTGVKQNKSRKLAPEPGPPNASLKHIESDNLIQSEQIIESAPPVASRVMRHYLLEIEDTFSDEYHVYFSDRDCNVLDYIKDTRERAHMYQSFNLNVDWRHKLNNCCWIKKDKSIQSMYPKVLIYPTTRFMRKPHPCKPGACTCCCRKKESVEKPSSIYTDKLYRSSDSNNQSSLEKGELEILDVEEKINKTVLMINTSQKMNEKPCQTNAKSNTLIGKALSYKGPVPAKQGENRRLVTVKRSDHRNTVIILREYVEGGVEIYEKDSEGDIVSYLKTTCYGNTNQSDVQNLLNKPNSVSETVCCWYKRQYIVTKLQNSIKLQPSAAMFIRNNHNCKSKECKCCCKPINVEKQLKKIQLPIRSLHRNTALKSLGLMKELESVSQSFQSSTCPIPSVATATETDNDDDCQITSVMTSPIFQSLPHKSAVPPNIFVPEAVDGDELSKEVNSLITSILDRFKDVRLTINNDGKVAAALNTPVNTLSTVELKVLANILSYAQSQIDLLGSKVNSGMSLSNIINLKLDNVQSNRAQLDPKSIYKEFGKNVNLNTNIQKQPMQSTNVNNTTLVFPQAPHVPQTYTFFTNATSLKNQHFNDAFSAYISTKMDNETIPVIENVFSLKPSENAQATHGTNEDSSFTTVWYRKPAQSNSSTLPENLTEPNASKKRNDNSTIEAVPSKKIRILSPNKLGADKSEGVASVHIPNHPNVPGVTPGMIILPNNFQPSGQSQTQGMGNAIPPTSVSQPILIIKPLHTASGLLSAPIGNNTQNTTDMSLPQSNVPVMINAASTSHVIGTDGEPQLSQTSVPVCINADVTETPDQDQFPGNDSHREDAEIEVVPEMDNEDMGNYETDDFEMKYSPQNNEEEEDCILGF